MDSELDLVSMSIIANSGDARSYAFGELEAAKSGDFAKAKELMQQSKQSATLAHKAQTDLLFKEANGEKSDVNVLLVHSQDHLMTSLLAQELIQEMITMYQTFKEGK